ncbi:MAG: JAB domain-containing protein [Clostridia bacterium]|nr:JAB domain-containing protein [Clostridia bacterium]
MADSELQILRKKIKEQYKISGSENLSDSQLLEAVLAISLSQCDGKEIAKSLLSEYSSLGNIFALSPLQLMKTDKLSESAAVYLSLAHHIKERTELAKNKRITDFSNTEAIVDFAKNMLSLQSMERVILVTLDSKRKLIKAKFISQGTANFANVMPVEISKRIIDEKPSYVFVAHNHLINTCVASFSDINFTINLSNWLDEFGIKLIDHIIVSKTEALSMAEDEDYAFIFD